jgi:hypothetical protein
MLIEAILRSISWISWQPDNQFGSPVNLSILQKVTSSWDFSVLIGGILDVRNLIHAVESIALVSWNSQRRKKV